MKSPIPTPEQRAALDRAKKGSNLFRAWHGKTIHKVIDAEKVAPLHTRLVRQ